MIEQFKKMKHYKKNLNKHLKMEPFIYVDGVKIHQQLPTKLRKLVNKIKILKIQKKVRRNKRKGRSIGTDYKRLSICKIANWGITGRVCGGDGRIYVIYIFCINE